jgi:hypothetical protein
MEIPSKASPLKERLELERAGEVRLLLPWLFLVQAFMSSNGGRVSGSVVPGIHLIPMAFVVRKSEHCFKHAESAGPNTFAAAG